MNRRSFLFFLVLTLVCVVHVCRFPLTATSASLLCNCNYASRPPSILFFVSLLSLALLCITTFPHTLAGRICIYIHAIFLLTHLGLLLHPHLVPNVHTSCRANSVIQNDKLLLLTTLHRQSLLESLLNNTRHGYSKLVCLRRLWSGSLL